MNYQTVNFLYSEQKQNCILPSNNEKTPTQNKSQALTDCQHNEVTKPHTVGITKQKIL
jgi:hypothetical protein